MVIYRISKGRKQYLRRIVQYRPLLNSSTALSPSRTPSGALSVVTGLLQTSLITSTCRKLGG